ncbi:MAG: chromosomal replication initiator protein DnaA [Rhabdochlamydiaceae bacterium]|nr:chromosomal replication initiator protein DnaA [Rhabdochlamydiaceae bacterium]
MQAWESFLSTLQKQLGDEAVTKWLRPLKIVHFDACNLYLEAQNSFQIEWFEEHIRSKAKGQFRNNNAHPIKIHLTSAEMEPREKKEKKALPPSSPPPFLLNKNTLQPEMTTENFIINPSNQILASLLASAKQKEWKSEFNPLFLYGAPCCGKTHLLQAFAHNFQSQNLQVLYIKAETFTENVVHAIRTGNMQDFRRAHRHADVLIVDDVEHLAKKSATQEEFFHTFNTLHSQGKQILLSADTSPSLLQDIEPRLISRFEWGLVLPIHKLEKEDLMRMLKIRCKTLSFPLSEAVLQFLIETFSSNIKSLQTSLEALILRTANLRSSALSVSKVKELLLDLMDHEKKIALNPKQIVLCVANFFSLSSEEILGKSQTQECAVPRQIAMFLCRNELKMPFTKIGEHFKRDHSTVMTSVRSVEEKIQKQDKELGSALVLIKQKMQRATH